MIEEKKTARTTAADFTMGWLSAWVRSGFIHLNVAINETHSNNNWLQTTKVPGKL